MMRSFALLALSLGVLTSPVCAQSINFTNANPPVAIQLLPGSQLAIDAQGNVNAECASTPEGCQRLVQGGGGSQCGSGATIGSLAVTNPGPAPGPYPGGSNITVVAQNVANAAVCVRDAVVLPAQTAVTVSGWSGNVTPTGSTISQVVTMPSQPSTTYRLRLVCYGSTGSDTKTIDVTTSTVTEPPPTNCPPPPVAPYTTVSAGSTTTRIIRGPGGSTLPIRTVEGWESLPNLFQGFPNPFPQTGTSGQLLDTPDTIRILRFTVPQNYSAPPVFSIVFNSWPNGFEQGLDAYVSVSTCPGDFRIPTATQNGTTSDPTFAEGCRNWRDDALTWQFGFGSGRINWRDPSIAGNPATSTPAHCVLERGRTYYLNMYMMRPNANRTLNDFTDNASSVCGINNPCGHLTSAGN